jgi:hypothetical protein
LTVLRAFVIAAGFLFLAGSGLAFSRGIVAAGIIFGINGIVSIGGIVFERYRYHKLQSLPPTGTDWRRTGEKFLDEDGKTNVEVWFNSTTGARRYVKGG